MFWIRQFSKPFFGLIGIIALVLVFWFYFPKWIIYSTFSEQQAREFSEWFQSTLQMLVSPIHKTTSIIILWIMFLPASCYYLLVCFNDFVASVFPERRLENDDFKNPNFKWVI